MRKLLICLLALLMLCGCSPKEEPAPMPEPEPEPEPVEVNSPLTQEQIDKLEPVGQAHVKEHLGELVIENVTAQDGKTFVSFKNYDEKGSNFAIYFMGDINYIDMFDGNERKVYGCENTELNGIDETAQPTGLDTISNLQIVDYNDGVTRVSGTMKNEDYDSDVAIGLVYANFEKDGVAHELVINFDKAGNADILRVDNKLETEFNDYAVDMEANKIFKDGDEIEYVVDKVINPESKEFIEVMLYYNDDGKVTQMEFNDDLAGVITYEFFADVPTIVYEAPENVEMVEEAEFARIIATLLFGNMVEDIEAD